MLTKISLLFVGMGGYFTFLQAGTIIPPEWLEKAGAITLLAGGVYYFYKQNEDLKKEYKELQLKYETKTTDIQNRVFDLEKQYITAIKDLNVVMGKMANTLDEIREDFKLVKST